MKTTTFVFVLLLIYASTFSVRAQQPAMGRGMQDRSSYYQFGDAFFCEPIITPKTNSDSVAVTFLFRIMNDIIAFSKAPRTRDSRGAYVATPLVTVEIRNSENVIIRRLGWKDSSFVSSFDKTNSKSDFVNGASATFLTSGTYTAEVTLGDKESVQIRKIKTKPIVIGKTNTVWWSNLFFAKGYNDSLQSRLIPVQMGGDVPFGTEPIAACFTIFGDLKDYRFSWKVEQTKTDEPGQLAAWGTFATVESTENANPSKSVMFTDESLFGSGTIPYLTISKSPEQPKTSLITIPMPIGTMLPGQYILKVYSSQMKDTITQKFDMRWDRMPMSLIKPSYAIECMYYILTDEEYDEMNSGNDEDKRKKMFAYWKAKDPTPATTYNEAMAEYFRRVDYAFFNFQTLTESDGAKSQRGKIYILFGSPKHIEKQLTDDNRVQETWSYPEKVKKEFVFEKTTNGIFKLVQTKDL